MNMRIKADVLNTLITFRHTPLGQFVSQLFESQEGEEIPNGGFAIAAQIVLKSGYATAGALTVEENGIFHMYQQGVVQNPNAKSAPGIPVIAHHYFQLHDIEAIIIVERPKEPSKIHLG